MRSFQFFFVLFFALWLPASAFGVTWGTYNTSSRRITATEGGSTITIQMPNPGSGSAGTYAGQSGDYHLYNKAGGQYRLKLDIQGASLFITLESFVSPNTWGNVQSPKVKLSSGATWRRVDVSQYGMVNGHKFNQKANYIDSTDLWVWAFWQPEESHGTLWTPNHVAYNANSGSGDLTLLPQMIYQQNLGGVRQTLKEKIEIRVGADLWDSVPTFPVSRNSPWAADMADTVYVDAWSHDSAAELTHLIQILKRLAGEETNFYTNWATWGTGGFDALLPDALWLGHNPPYPPNHKGFGSLDKMRNLADVGDAAGWFSFRTFYSQVREAGPSYQAGLVRKILAANGNPTIFGKRGDIPTIYQRQEPEIHSHLGSSAIFTDTLCAGFPSSYRDYDAVVPDGLSMKAAVEQDRTMADYLELQHGPVSCESMLNEVLLGTWIATGEYEIRNGLNRLITPEYKLRRLHGLTTYHGLGLNYRFMAISDLWSQDRYGYRDQHQRDAYRAVQMLFGNGAFIFLENNLEDAVWNHMLSELFLVRPLQEHFALKPVSTIEYETSGQSPGSWHTLEDLVENQNFVMKTNFGTKIVMGSVVNEAQSPEFERIRVTYANGLKVLVNRGATNFSVNAGGQSLTLPPDGWAAWGTISGQSVLAYSAFAPGTSQRVDYIEDLAQGLRYIDPRGGTHQGVVRPTQWVRKDGIWRVRLEADLDGAWPAVRLEGQHLHLGPARKLASPTLDTDFTQGLGGWRTIIGAREPQVSVDGLELELIAETPILHSPRLELAGGTGDVIEIDVRFNQPTSGSAEFGLFFKREEDAAFSGTRLVPATLQVNGGWQTLSFPVGTNGLWQGSTIKHLRLDPGRFGQPARPFDMTLGAVRWVPGP